MKERFDKIIFFLSEKSFLYVILTGILFLVNELRENAVYYTITENCILIILVLAFTLIVNFLSRKFIENKTKAALLASLFIFVNLFFQDIFRAILGQKEILTLINSTSSKSPVVIISSLIFLAWLVLSFIIFRINRFSKVLNLYLNIVIIAFILVEPFKGILVPVQQIKLSENESFPVNAKLTHKQKPDIYYIILDAYTSSESLKVYWNYDNSAFEDSLKQLGFSIAGKSKTDYIYTPFCVASYLNSSSLIFDTTKTFNEWNLLNLIRHNRLSIWLDANGYKCYNYSLFDTFGSKKFFLGYNKDNHFLGRTIWYAIVTKMYHYLIPSSRLDQANLKIFNILNHKRDENIDSPIFTYAHVMMPHNPYFFDKDGKPLNQKESLSEKQKYLGQLIYTNSLTLESINHILTLSPGKPIIIIQGDHGYRSLEDTTKIEKSKEAHTIFYAIYTPFDIMVSDSLNPSSTFNKLIEEINY